METAVNIPSPAGTIRPGGWRSSVFLIRKTISAEQQYRREDERPRIREKKVWDETFEYQVNRFRDDGVLVVGGPA